MKKVFLTFMAVSISLILTTAAMAGDNYVTSAIAYPTGNAASSSLLLEKMYPKKARVGQEYGYKIKATNLTDFTLEAVEVTEVIPSGFSVAEASPKYDNRSGDTYTWQIGNLGPRKSVVIEVTGKATSGQAVPCCTAADYVVPALCHKTILENPSLSVQVQSPDSKLVCENIPLTFVVKNTGDSYLENVNVESALPYGVRSESGKGMLLLKVGDLPVGESRTVGALVKPENVGAFKFVAQAQSDDVEATALGSQTQVVQPKLDVRVTSNKREQFIGRDVIYTYEVKNPSEVAAKDAVLKARLPKNTSFQSASDGGRVSGDMVQWSLGTIDAYGSERVQVTVKAKSFGEAETTAVAKAVCCQSASDAASVTFVGIPALLLEVVDVVDPIEIGDTQTYQIRVTNQGTAIANNVQIKAMLEGMSYLSDSGETRSTNTSGGQITFAPVTRLEPKEAVSWAIKVSGDRAGDLRFRVSLTSDELTRPVEEAESTYVY